MMITPLLINAQTSGIDIFTPESKHLFSSRNAAETKITALERNIKTLMVEIEELRQVKINLEGSISKWQAENADWKKKYENEARLRVEEGDALKKKFTLEITSLTDNLHNLEQKLKAAENAKVDKNTK